jgi:V/A-type H+-transporting ATPase subunit I
MPPGDGAGQVPMARIAIVAPRGSLRAALVRIADLGVVEFDRISAPGDAATSEPARRLQRFGQHPDPRLSEEPPDLAAWESDGRSDLLAGEAQLVGLEDDAVVRHDVAALIGWTPSAEVEKIRTALADVGAAAAILSMPRGVQPPTAAVRSPVHDAFTPLVNTYATVPYVDIDPTFLAGLSYIVMFGAMFGDVGQGALLVLGAVLIGFGRFARLARLRPYWRFIAGAGLSSAFFGLLYGECFGPTGIVPTAWLAPMDHPIDLLVAGIGLGAVLLAGAYAVGTINRVREGGWARALYAPSGVAGSALFLAAGLAVFAWYARSGWLALAALLLAFGGLVLAFVGLLAAAGHTGSGVAQATVELFDLVIRIGANVMSFARLAAFGLTHAVLAWIVWSATVSLWSDGSIWIAAAIIVFVVGNAVTFTLEALVAAVQALRLEYYELFSRVFEREGRPFRPWHVPIERSDGAIPPSGDRQRYVLTGGK